MINLDNLWSQCREDKNLILCTQSMQLSVHGRVKSMTFRLWSQVLIYMFSELYELISCFKKIWLFSACLLSFATTCQNQTLSNRHDCCKADGFTPPGVLARRWGWDILNICVFYPSAYRTLRPNFCFFSSKKQVLSSFTKMSGKCI